MGKVCVLNNIKAACGSQSPGTFTLIAYLFFKAGPLFQSHDFVVVFFKREELIHEENSHPLENCCSLLASVLKFVYDCNEACMQLFLLQNFCHALLYCYTPVYIQHLLTGPKILKSTKGEEQPTLLST